MLSKHFFPPHTSQIQVRLDLGLKGGNKAAPARTEHLLSPHSAPRPRPEPTGLLGNTVPHRGHDSPPPPSYTSVSEQDSRSAIAIWLPSCSNASSTFRGGRAGETRRCPSPQLRPGRTARHGTAHRRLTWPPHLGSCAVPPLAEQKGSRAAGGSAASPPASARRSPAHKLLVG